jgi:hypothetical protein
MAIGVIWKPPIDAATYDAIRERMMQAEIDRGSRLHAAGESRSGTAHGGAGGPRRPPRGDGVAVR